MTNTDTADTPQSHSFVLYIGHDAAKDVADIWEIITSRVLLELRSREVDPSVKVTMGFIPLWHDTRVEVCWSSNKEQL